MARVILLQVTCIVIVILQCSGGCQDTDADLAGDDFGCKNDEESNDPESDDDDGDGDEDDNYEEEEEEEEEEYYGN